MRLNQLLIIISFFYSNALNKPSFLWKSLSNTFKDKARDWFITRAENDGIQWRQMSNKYNNNESNILLNRIKNIKENKSIIYPEYYLQPFHGYDTGNMNWECCYEGQASTLAISSNYWKGANITSASEWFRNNITSNIYKYHHSYNITFPKQILDIGCSLGISTEHLKKSFNNSDVIGLDLSPYFISMASLLTYVYKTHIPYIHANAESIPLKDNTMDMITFNFILHEVPLYPTINILKEAKRLLKKNGTIVIIDLDQNKLKDRLQVSNFRRWAFEVTEPHIYEYYTTNFESLLYSIGFNTVRNYSNDPLNTVIIAQN